MAAKTANKEDEKWRAQSDARTLAEAHAIQKDSERMKKATEAAKDLTDETRRHANETGASADAMQMLATKMYPTMGAGQTEGDGQ